MALRLSSQLRSKPDGSLWQRARLKLPYSTCTKLMGRMLQHPWHEPIIFLMKERLDKEKKVDQA